MPFIAQSFELFLGEQEVDERHGVVYGVSQDIGQMAVLAIGWPGIEGHRCRMWDTAV
jgi:hypothetical protein